MQIDLKKLIKRVGSLPKGKIHQAKEDEILKRDLKDSFSDELEADLASFKFSITPSLTYYCKRKPLEGKQILASEDLYLVHEVKGRVAAEAEAGIGSYLDLGLAASKQLILSNYKRHGGSEKIEDAVANDLLSFGSILNKDHVLNLAKGNALSLSGSGKLKFDLKASWSDMISGQVSMLSSIIGPNSVGVELGAAAEVKFGVEIEDDYEAFIQRLTSNRFKVALRKINKKSSSAAAAIKLSVGLEEESTKQMVSKLFEATESEVFKLLDTKKLSVIENSKIAKAAESMGLDIDSSKQKVKKTYEEKRRELGEKLIEIARKKLELSISYEYQKTQTRESLLELQLQKEDVELHHDKIWKLQIEELFEVAKQDDSIKVLNFFERLKTEVSRQFGIKLSLGKFTLKSTITRAFKEEIEIKGEERHTRVSNYFRETEKDTEDIQYYLNFKAQMPQFVSDEKQFTVDRFLMEFRFGMDRSSIRTNDSYFVEDLVDLAVLWGMIDAAEQDKMIEESRLKLKGASNISTSVELTFSELDEEQSSLKDNFLDNLVDSMCSGSRSLKAAVLAQSMLYAKHRTRDLSDRQNPMARQAVYQSFWSAYLSQWKSLKNLSKVGRANAIKDLFDREVFSDDLSADILWFERDSTNTNLKYRGLEQTLERRQPGDDFEDLEKAFKVLNEALRNKRNYKTPFKNFQSKWDNFNYKHPFCVRYLGRYMLHKAAEVGLQESKISASIKINYKKGGKEQILHIA